MEWIIATMVALISTGIIGSIKLITKTMIKVQLQQAIKSLEIIQTLLLGMATVKATNFQKREDLGEKIKKKMRKNTRMRIKIPK